MLVLEHVSKSFGAVRALDDASIELYAGEAHALVACATHVLCKRERFLIDGN